MTTYNTITTGKEINVNDAGEYTSKGWKQKANANQRATPKNLPRFVSRISKEKLKTMGVLEATL